MRIAVVSDTHDLYLPRLPKLLVDADEIWHLGDVCAPTVLVEFEQLNRPLHVVLGNNDYYAGWPLTYRREIAGHRCYLQHIAPTRPPTDCDIILHGHTHIPRDEMMSGIRWLNPGAITYPRGGNRASFAWLTLETGKTPHWEVVLL